MPAVDPLSGLVALLEEERRVLLAGDFAALADLGDRKERLLAIAESSTRPDAPGLAALRSAAEANRLLLAAALRGVRAARERLDTARSGGPALSTYDASGRAETHGRGTTVERRA